jgi:hypothetical protein
VRIVLNIVGLILAFFGIVWILQGLGIHIKWVVIGAVVLVAAIAILISANRGTGGAVRES